MLSNVFVFDIETIPDYTTGRKIHGLHDVDDKAVSDAMFALRRQTHGTDFLPLYLQKIVAISVVFHTREQLKVWSLGEPESTEKELIERFFAGLEKHIPTLVSWNGSAFDLPVLHYRSLLHGVSAPLYWETGEANQQFRWNNYLNRYHYRHLDLMDVLAAYQSRANAPLNDISTMLGFPGKMGMSGASVWEYYQAGKISEIRDYCETDVLNTYLIYLRFEMMRSVINFQQYQKELDRVRQFLIESNKSHFAEFLRQWGASEISE